MSEQRPVCREVEEVALKELRDLLKTALLGEVPYSDDRLLMASTCIERMREKIGNAIEIVDYYL